MHFGVHVVSLLIRQSITISSKTLTWLSRFHWNQYDSRLINPLNVWNVSGISCFGQYSHMSCAEYWGTYVNYSLYVVVTCGLVVWLLDWWINTWGLNPDSDGDLWLSCMAPTLLNQYLRLGSCQRWLLIAYICPSFLSLSSFLFLHVP